MPLPTSGSNDVKPVPPLLPTRHILALDDDDNFREMLTNELAEHGFAVRAYADATSFLEALAALDEADLILLDWSLPQGSGLDLLPQIRRLGVNVPVVFLTGRALIANETQAFDRGAVDFIDKARGIPILVRRLRNVRHAKAEWPQADKILEVGALKLKLQVSRGFWKGRDLDFTLGEFKIVNLLAANAGSYVTYRDIYDCLHYRGFHAGNGEDDYRTNVRSAIKRIRCKFRSADPSFDSIVNYTAFGYIWKAIEGNQS